LHTQVKVIPDGGQALKYLSKEEHACENLVAIFLDMHLPILSGLQLLRAIRTQERIRHLPVILMTSSNDPKEIEHCHALGISHFVSKPITFPTFAKAVASVFHNGGAVLLPRHARDNGTPA
jgi:CheY-like chemotaxis protein